MMRIDFNEVPIQADIIPLHRPADPVDPVSAFEAELTRAGYQPGPIMADGEIQRFDIKKRGDKAGWYWLALDGVPGAGYGDFISGNSLKWSAIRQSEMTPQQIADTARRYEAAKQKREAIKAAENEAAKIKAARTWEAASPAPDDHQYLQTKGVVSYDLKIDGQGQLIVPMRDNDGAIWSLQTIRPDGAKRFLSGGAKKGNYFTIPGGDTVYIVEGYATGASIHEATGGTVIVAFDSGNLKPVAEAIRAKHPSREIVICGDNDQWTKKPDGTPYNPGVEAARAAGQEIGARVVIPTFEDTADRPTDFNDLARLNGPQAVKDQIAVGTANPLEGTAYSMADFRGIEIQERTAYLHPWLKEESIILIYGWRGAGKTWFGLSIGDAITRDGSFGNWDCQKPVPCLYLDGEMTIGDNQERIDALNLATDRKEPFYIMCEHQNNRLGCPRANLTDEKWRKNMKALLLDKGVKVWIVDNLASLAPGLDENVRQDWYVQSIG